MTQKSHTLLCALPTFLLGIVALLLNSCGLKAENTEGGIQFEKVAVSDSVVMHGVTVARVEIQTVMPQDVASCDAADSIYHWICEELKLPADETKGNVQGAVKSAVSKVLKSYEEEGFFNEEALQDEYFMPWSLDIKCTKHYEDENYITIRINIWEYTGGIHEFGFCHYATFRRSDGHRMDWDLLEGMKQEEVVAGIQNGLLHYFDLSSLEELPAAMSLVDEDEAKEGFPLPQCPPFMSEEGVCVIYQPYEIAPLFRRNALRRRGAERPPQQNAHYRGRKVTNSPYISKKAHSF